MISAITHAIKLLAVVCLMAGAGAALGATASQLIGHALQNERGEPVGKVEDLIVDVRDGRVLYLIVKDNESFQTFPVRALGRDLRLNTGLAGETANLEPSSDPRFRRAAKLIGQPLVHPHPGGTQRIGTISDIEFDPATGRVEYVHVSTGEGMSHFAAGVLRHGRFPPLTQWRHDYLDADELDNLGYLRREPSSERLQLHEHKW
jgi:sporulation protein YlmC with PRC-barrel domain